MHTHEALYGRFMDREAAVWIAEHEHSRKLPCVSVLLVSGVEADHATLRRVLAAPGFRLAGAHSGTEFEAALQRRSPMVVLADCQDQDWSWRDV